MSIFNERANLANRSPRERQKGSPGLGEAGSQSSPDRSQSSSERNSSGQRPDDANKSAAMNSAFSCSSSNASASASSESTSSPALTSTPSSDVDANPASSSYSVFTAPMTSSSYSVFTSPDPKTPSPLLSSNRSKRKLHSSSPSIIFVVFFFFLLLLKTCPPRFSFLFFRGTKFACCVTKYWKTAGPKRKTRKNTTVSSHNTISQSQGGGRVLTGVDFDIDRFWEHHLFCFTVIFNSPSSLVGTPLLLDGKQSKLLHRSCD